MDFLFRAGILKRINKNSVFMEKNDDQTLSHTRLTRATKAAR
jgi:hypothetical protein